MVRGKKVYMIRMYHKLVISCYIQKDSLRIFSKIMKRFSMKNILKKKANIKQFNLFSLFKNTCVLINILENIDTKEKEYEKEVIGSTVVYKKTLSLPDDNLALNTLMILTI